MFSQIEHWYFPIVCHVQSALPDTAEAKKSQIRTRSLKLVASKRIVWLAQNCIKIFYYFFEVFILK